jgi:hypothetical protein
MPKKEPSAQIAERRELRTVKNEESEHTWQERGWHGSPDHAACEKEQKIYQIKK